jgi:hypothetical protein
VTGFRRPVPPAEKDYWYPTPNNTEPSVAMIRSIGSLKSNGDGIGSAGMQHVSHWMCLGKARNEIPMPDV